jgi:hypothetical protein
MGEESLQQAELTGREAHCPAPHAHLTPHNVQADAVDDQQPRRRGYAVPEMCAHPGQQFFEHERLHQVVVRAEVETVNPVLHPPSGAQDQDGDAGAALERLAPGAHPLDAVAVRPESFHEERRDAFFSLDEEKFHRAFLTQSAALRPGRRATPGLPRPTREIPCMSGPSGPASTMNTIPLPPGVANLVLGPSSSAW